MTALLVLACVGVIVGVTVGWVLLADSAGEIFKEW